LEDYVKAIDLLTIDSDKSKLEKQVKGLKEKSKDNDYLIKAKLQQKDEQIKIIGDQLSEMKNQMQLYYHH
jgi:hypothetical protein